LMTAIGPVAFTRRYFTCSCGAGGSSAADEPLGVEGQRYSVAVQKHCCRLAGDAAFAKASAEMHEMLGVDVCPETVRKMVEAHGQKMARFQTQDVASEEAFRQAEGEVEFTVDAGKANTREEGWKDLKIGVAAKRQAGEPVSPEQWKSQRLPLATMVLAFAMIAPAREFRKSWRSRLRRLGVRSMASLHVLADGASWIWKAVGRVLTGCVQTLDFYHACQHLNRCAERLYGEGTAQTAQAYRHARSLPLRQGWAGVCQWVSELLAVEEEAERERRRKATDRLLGYFGKHVGRLNYAERLGAGRAIGSGQVEGKAKTLGLRLKARGARWRMRNVQAMASLVCVRHSSQWEAYWAVAA
jgi:hypothetical protein